MKKILFLLMTFQILRSADNGIAPDSWNAFVKNVSSCKEENSNEIDQILRTALIGEGDLQVAINNDFLYYLNENFNDPAGSNFYDATKLLSPLARTAWDFHHDENGCRHVVENLGSFNGINGFWLDYVARLFIELYDSSVYKQKNQEEEEKEDKTNKHRIKTNEHRMELLNFLLLEPLDITKMAVKDFIEKYKEKIPKKKAEISPLSQFRHRVLYNFMQENVDPDICFPESYFPPQNKLPEEKIYDYIAGFLRHGKSQKAVPVSSEMIKDDRDASKKLIEILGKAPVKKNSTRQVWSPYYFTESDKKTFSYRLCLKIFSIKDFFSKHKLVVKKVFWATSLLAISSLWVSKNKII